MRPFEDPKGMIDKNIILFRKCQAKFPAKKKLLKNIFRNGLKVRVSFSLAFKRILTEDATN
jgi:hypothetical protein